MARFGPNEVRRGIEPAYRSLDVRTPSCAILTAESFFSAVNIRLKEANFKQESEQNVYYTGTLPSTDLHLEMGTVLYLNHVKALKASVKSLLLCLLQSIKSLLHVQKARA